MDYMDIKERRKRLSDIARTDTFNRQFHANDIISAIDTLNKMDNLYKQLIEVDKQVVHTFIFLLPDGTRFTPGKAIEGDVKLLRETAGDWNRKEKV